MKKTTKNKLGKRFILLFFSLVLIAGALPAAALAQEQTEPAVVQSVAPEVLPNPNSSDAQNQDENSLGNLLLSSAVQSSSSTSLAGEADSVSSAPVVPESAAPEETLPSAAASSGSDASILPDEPPAIASGIAKAGIANGKQAVRLMGRMETEYTLHFDVNGGIAASKPASQTMGEWYLATNPQDPEHATKTFINWNISPDGSGMTWEFDTQTMPAYDVTLYAQWMSNSYVLLFDVNGGIPATQPESQVVEAGQYLMQPNDPLHAAYQFINWNTQPDGAGMAWDFDSQTMPAQDTTLYAQWMAAAYTLTFDVNGGETPAPQSQALFEGEFAASVSAPLRAGYDFLHWNTQPDGAGMAWDFDAQAMPAQDITLYALWQTAPSENNTLPSVPAPAPSQPEAPKPNPLPKPDSSTSESGAVVLPQPEISSSKPGSVASSKPDVSSSVSSKPTITSSSSTAEPPPDGAAVTVPPTVVSSSSVSSTSRRPVSSPSTSSSESNTESTLPGAVGNNQDTHPPSFPDGGTQGETVPTETANIAGTDTTNSPSLFTIANGLIPFSSGGQWPAWALLNLILAIASVAMAAVLGIRFATRRPKNAEVHAPQTQPTRFAKIKQYGAFRLASIGVALIASVLFLLTENLRNTMVLTDSWTIVMLLLTAGQVALMLLSTNRAHGKKKNGAQDAKHEQNIYRRQSAQP